MTDWPDRITINPERCVGHPCIRGMRIRVIDVLDLQTHGLTADQIIDELPDLDSEGISAVLQYAARRLGHSVLAA